MTALNRVKKKSPKSVIKFNFTFFLLKQKFIVNIGHVL